MGEFGAFFMGRGRMNGWVESHAADNGEIWESCAPANRKVQDMGNMDGWDEWLFWNASGAT